MEIDVYGCANIAGEALSCDSATNLATALDSVVATCTGCNRHSDDSIGGASVAIDGDHSPGTWTSAPHAGADTCATQAYVTIDLLSLIHI